MVRNWDTVRAILLKLEAAETAKTTVTLNQVDGVAPQEVGYHMMLLNEAGLIEANILESSTDIGRYIQSDPIGLAGGINTYAYVNSKAFTPPG